MTKRKKMKLARVSKDLTQTQIAERMGIGTASYNLIEKGNNYGTIKFWKNYQRVLDVKSADMWDIITEKEDEKEEDLNKSDVN